MKNLQNCNSEILLTDEVVRSFSLRSRVRQICPFLSLIFNTVLEVVARASSQDKEIQGIQLGKHKVKLSLLTDAMFRNPAEHTKLLKNPQQVSLTAYQ